jgi:hypothetical protein
MFEEKKVVNVSTYIMNYFLFEIIELHFMYSTVIKVCPLKELQLQQKLNCFIYQHRYN